MKDLPSSAQSAIEYGVVLLLVIIILAGSFKLYEKWTTPSAADSQKASHPISLNAGKKLMEKPSKELCTYVMNQCRAKYDMK